MRTALALLLVSTAAQAQSLPGTGEDPMRVALVSPAFVISELPLGLPVRGGNPEDTLLLFDGFELPWAFHDNGLRGVVPPLTVDMDLLASGASVQYGRASSFVELTSTIAQPVTFADVTVLDAGIHDGYRTFAAGARYGWNRALRDQRRAASNVFGDAIARSQTRISERWTAAVSGAFAEDGDRSFIRPVLATDYKSPTWRAHLAASVMRVDADRDELALDTRIELLRQVDEAAGLRKLQWMLGQQTNSTRFELDDKLWRHDIALWSLVSAHLAPAIRATTGVRVDSFDGDVATQPRASVVADLSRHLTAALGAGAYRRPPRQLDEVAATLHPERATHVVAAARFDDRHGITITGSAYYIDRTRLVVRDDTGAPHNTGFGTALGMELDATWQDGPWFARGTTALRSSTRRDALRGADHPAEYDQPFRLDLIGGWSHRRAAISGRLQLASGLPYTPYTDSLYNSDTDSWEPLYARPLSARAPFHHQIDLRAEYRFALRPHVLVDVFVDLHNAYANRDAIGYTYSYDYRQRFAISALPIFPFAGLRVWL